MSFTVIFCQNFRIITRQITQKKYCNYRTLSIALERYVSDNARFSHRVLFNIQPPLMQQVAGKKKTAKSDKKKSSSKLSDAELNELVDFDKFKMTLTNQVQSMKEEFANQLSVRTNRGEF